MTTETWHEQSLAARVRELTHQQMRRLLVTSTGPAEGKSSVVAGLGTALARAGMESVLLVDANPIHPNLHTALDVRPACGLSDLVEAVYFCDLLRENPDQFGVGDWLEILRAQMRTGELVVTQGDRRISIRLTKGEVASLSNAGSRPEHSLGHLLMRAGWVTAATLERGLRMHEGTGRPLGEVLRTLGQVTDTDLSVALLDQAHAALMELITLRQPECRFHEAAEAYRPVSGGRTPIAAEHSAIGALLTGSMRDYLESPFISGQIPAYICDTALPNLKLIPGGTRPSTLQGPARGRAVGALIERVSRLFDIVLIDAAEVGLMSPTAELAGLVDGTLLVVKADHEHVEAIRTAIVELRRTGGRVLGVVLSHGASAGFTPLPITL